jgi:hypothetical protein
LILIFSALLAAGVSLACWAFLSFSFLASSAAAASSAFLLAF